MRCPECSGVGIAATYKLDPENYKVGVRVSPAHISDQWDFIYRGDVGQADGETFELDHGGIQWSCCSAVSSDKCTVYLMTALVTPYLTAYLISDRRQCISCVMVAIVENSYMFIFVVVTTISAFKIFSNTCIVILHRNDKNVILIH